jgi:haloacetate dehalogenase
VRAICEDDRARVTIEMKYGEIDRNIRIKTPILVLWRADVVFGGLWDLTQKWRERADEVSDSGVPGCGPIMPEAHPDV